MSSPWFFVPAVVLGAGCLDDDPDRSGQADVVDVDSLDDTTTDVPSDDTTPSIDTLDTNVADTDDTATTPDTDDTTTPDTDDTNTPDSTTDTSVADVPPVEELPLFSFFVTSLEAMRELSGSQDGFGGDLRFGEATGLAGADKICATIAEKELPGASQKRWRAFLSASDDGNGNTVHAIDRIGSGPWYDRNGRLVAENVAGLLATRPNGNAQVKNDLPNERGESQKTQPGPNASGYADNHDVLTGSTSQGRLESSQASYTCSNWTSTGSGRPRLGHSWPAQSGQGWIQAHSAGGCQAVVNITNNGGGDRNCQGVGCAGGYGAIYCFAEVP